jgi:lambda family phage tail tape measure protein
MERVSNAFTYAAIKTTAEIRDFAVAMTHAAAPALRLVNKSMEEGTSVLMAFARAGIVGEEAGTLLWTTVRDLQRASIKARGEWKELGLEIYDTQGRMRNLADIFTDLENKFAGMSDEGKKVSLMLLGFQDRSLRGIQALMGFSDVMRESQDEMMTLGFLTKALAEKYLSSFRSEMKMLWNQIVVVGIAVGERLVPAIKEVVKIFQQNQGAIKQWAVVIAGFVSDAIIELNNFLRFLLYDWRKGLELIQSIFGDIATGAGKVFLYVMEQVFVTVGRNISGWIKRGIWGEKMLIGRALDEAAVVIYKQRFSWMERMRKPWADVTKELDKIKKEIKASLGSEYFAQVDVPEFVPLNIDQEKIKSILAETGSNIEDSMRAIGYTMFKEGKSWVDVLGEHIVRFKGVMEQHPWVTFARVLVGQAAKMKVAVNEQLGNTARVEVSMKKLKQPLRDIYVGLESQYEAIGRTNEELVRYQQELELIKVLEEEFGYTEHWLPEEAEAYAEQLQYINHLYDEILRGRKSFARFFDASKQWAEDASYLWENLGEDLSRGLDDFADTFTEMLSTGSANWKQFLAGLLKDWLNTIIRMQMVTAWTNFLKPLLGGLATSLGFGNISTGLGKALVGGTKSSAKGNVFGFGNVIPMAAGSIIDVATLAPMSRGRTALMGESGPEAVMPLTRDREGRLAVHAEQPQVNVESKTKIVNLFDHSEIHAAMATREGERLIINVLRRNGVI